MILIPALAVLDGRVVATTTGASAVDTAACETLADDPVAAARSLVADGALFFHVVDLDAVFSTGRDNHDVLRAFVDAGLPCQVRGGVRCAESAARLLATGVDRVVVGRLVHDAPEDVVGLVERFGVRVVAGVEVANADGGAAADSVEHVASRVAEAKACGVAQVLLTRIDLAVASLRSTVDAIHAALAAAGGELQVIAHASLADDADVDCVTDVFTAGLGGLVVADACGASRAALAHALAPA